jgi:hypothetical protein
MRERIDAHRLAPWCSPPPEHEDRPHNGVQARLGLNLSKINIPSKKPRRKLTGFVSALEGALSLALVGIGIDQGPRTPGYSSD